MKRTCGLSDGGTVLQSRECIGTEAERRPARADFQTSVDKNYVRGPLTASRKDCGGAIAVNLSL